MSRGRRGAERWRARKSWSYFQTEDPDLQDERGSSLLQVDAAELEASLWSGEGNQNHLLETVLVQSTEGLLRCPDGALHVRGMVGLQGPGPGPGVKVWRLWRIVGNPSLSQN